MFSELRALDQGAWLGINVRRRSLTSRGVSSQLLSGADRGAFANWRHQPPLQNQRGEGRVHPRSNRPNLRKLAKLIPIPKLGPA